ncbi:hypothetical protein [Bdellovibrio sp. HCB-162]|uniref:hypothetical protein n=1 Tax=Bdellovibrio sp. HCB-162 TaxID=3394234 RepID=UPI0039BC7012
MTTISFGVVVFIVSLAYWILDTFFDTHTFWSRVAKTIAFLLVIGTGFSTFLSYKETAEAELKANESAKTILQLENKVLIQEKKLLTQEVRSLKIQSELTEEKNRIKAFSAEIYVTIKGNWTPETSPYAPNAIIQPIQDTVLLIAYPNPKPRWRPLYFYPSQMFNLFEGAPGNLFFYATLSLRSDADIFAAKKSETLELQKYEIRVPLLRWQALSKVPLTVTYSKIDLRVNDSEIYTLQRQMNETFLPAPPSGIYGDLSGQYLTIPLIFTKKDFIRYKIKR